VIHVCVLALTPSPESLPPMPPPPAARAGVSSMENFEQPEPKAEVGRPWPLCLTSAQADVPQFCICGKPAEFDCSRCGEWFPLPN
jgi:hypothetical protein